jgi:hypothetical protein
LAFLTRTFVAALALGACGAAGPPPEGDDPTVEDPSPPPPRTERPRPTPTVDGAAEVAPGEARPAVPAAPGRPDAAALEAGVAAEAGASGLDTAAPPDAAGAPGADAAGLASDAAPASSGACASRKVAICDDFERTGIDRTVWKVANGDNLRIDSTRAFRGRQSLFVRGVNRRDGGGKLYLDGAAVSAFRDGFYGRAHVYFAGRTPRTHSDLVFAWGPANGGTVVWRYGVEAHNFTGNWWGAGGEGAFPSDRFFTKRDAVPVDRWFCMEWHFDSKANQMRFWLDGAERRSLWRAGGNWPAPPFQRIEIGFQIFGQDPGGDFSLWFDEVALDRERIGCAP